MAAKLLHSLADDNPDLPKQIGCMTGMLQIFDRQHMGRHLSGQNHKRLLPPGNPECSNVSLDADSSNSYRRETMERIASKYTSEKRLSNESSMPSFSSSSHSSSFSSLDCGRLSHPDSSSLDRVIFPDTPSNDPVITQPSPNRKVGRLSLDLRDAVKGSIHRDARVLSVQQRMKEDEVDQLSKPRNSPCPADQRESTKGPAKLQEAPRNRSNKQHVRLSYETKNESSLSISRDARRYSYDGRETNHLSCEPREFSRSNSRINELPRLSLDSNESSMRTSSYDTSYNEDFLSTKQLSRPPSVVAKLMGLETFLDNNPNRDGHSGSTISFEDCRRHTMQLKASDVCRPNRLPVSPRSSKKEPISPRWKNAEMRPTSTLMCSTKPAPWKHLDGSRTSQQQAPRRLKSPESTLKSAPSVYSEIEKRLKDIEFKQSGKDLRALKQILEAMQGKGLLGMSKQGQNLNMGAKREEHPYTGLSMNSTFMNPNESQRSHSGASARRRISSNAYESPIVIMKPAKLAQRSGIPTSSPMPVDGLPDLGLQRRSINRRQSKDQSSVEIQRESTAKSSTDRKDNSRTMRDAQNSTRAHRLSNNTSISSSKNIESTNPGLQKKLEFDCPPTPPDSGKSRRQSNRQSTTVVGSGSPAGRRRPKPNFMQQNSDQLDELSSEPRNISSLRDDISMQSSDGPATPEPKRVVEVTERQILPFESSKYPGASEIKTSSSTRSSDDEALPAISLEQPSPISVLDDSVYRENSPPPVKQTSLDLEGVKTKTIEQDYGSGFSTEINHKKLQSVDNLIQKLRQLNANHDEANTDYIASLCENSIPDHRYVSEILLASGLLLRDLSSGLSTFQLHPSGYLINPELFVVLEQTKSSSFIFKAEPSQQKLHRKLVFDTVNEILSRKLASTVQDSEPWCKPNKLSRKTVNAQKLLAELCVELEQFEASERRESSLDEEDDSLKTVLWEDVMHRSESWTDFHGDISGMVLDVERSIFKELVNEVVNGEASPCRANPSGRRRQLFSG